MSRITTATSKESVPPILWGVLPWKMPDGMNAAQAQVVMKAFIEKTHRIDLMSRVLGVPMIVGKLYLQDERTIPKGIVAKLPRLEEILKKNPARLLEMLDKERELARRRHESAMMETEIEEVSSRAVKEINSYATAKAGRAMQLAREAKGWETSEAVARMKAAGIKIYDSYVAKIERIGITPRSMLFFPLCEFWGIEPESFGFVETMRVKIIVWRKKQREDHGERPQA